MKRFVAANRVRHSNIVVQRIPSRPTRWKQWLLFREPPNNLMHVLGFVSNVLGFGAFVWTFYAHFQEQKRDHLKQQTRQLQNDVKAAELTVRETDPRKICTKIKQWLATGNEGRETLFSMIFKRRNQIDKLADHWIQELENREEWAVRVDVNRSTLKNMWFVTMRTYENLVETNNEEMIKPLLMENYPLGKHVALTTIMMIEPLDKAAYRARLLESEEEFDWEAHCPPIYKFIRQVYDIDDAWPYNEDEDVKAVLVQRPSGRLSHKEEDDQPS